MNFSMEPAEVRSARESLGLTQGQAARLIGVDARTWRYWEGGGRTIPVPVCRLLALCKRPGVIAALDAMAKHPTL